MASCQYQKRLKLDFLSGRTIMWHLNCRRLLAHLSSYYEVTRRISIVIVPCIVILMIALASCGSTSAGKITTVTPVPTLAPSPTVIPTYTPTPTFTPKPTPAPTEVPQPTQQPTSASAILDLQPLSMSIVGHLDCQKKGDFVCLARVLSRSTNQDDLHWTAFTNVQGNIGFSPVNGILAPGQSVLVTITVPFSACTPGLFFFRGPVNTHTITWAC
jgi:hypothetical protein